MLVAENLLLRVLSGNARTPDDFDVAVQAWTAYVAGRGEACMAGHPGDDSGCERF
jgi:hypothetical protein